MNDAKLLVRKGDDLEDFNGILGANFGGNVTDYMEAATRIFAIVLTDKIGVMEGGNLTSLVEKCRPHKAPRRFAKNFPFQLTSVIKYQLAQVNDHQFFEGCDEQSMFYTASRTYQKLVDIYLDEVEFVNQDRESVKLDFGGVLELVHPFELCTEEDFYLLAEAWLEMGQNNLHDLSPMEIEPMLQELYRKASASPYPRSEILEISKYQKKFKKLRLV